MRHFRVELGVLYVGPGAADWVRFGEELCYPTNVRAASHEEAITLAIENFLSQFQKNPREGCWPKLTYVFARER